MKAGCVWIALLLAIAGCGAPPAGRGLEPLVVGSPALEQAALIYVAAEQGLFERHGLAVTVRDYPSGPAALAALLAGEVDIAETAEYPLVRLILENQPLAAVATNDKFENDYLVARPDRGIAAAADLAGKRVGLARGTIVEFYLARLLELAGVPAAAVTVVDLAPDGVVPALAAGEVDAIVTWQPHVERAQAAVPAAVVLPAQSSQPVFGVLVARQAWVRDHREPLTRFLRALHEAELALHRDPAAGQEVVRARLGYDAAYLDAVWPQHQFGLSLDQPLVIAMKDEAQWLIRQGLAPAAQLPDFEAYIDSAALAAVKPDAVNLVR